MFIFGYNPGNSDLFPASANPWSATPVRTNPAYTYLTPAQVPAAEEMNYIFYSTSKAAAAGVSVPGASWTTKILATAVSGFFTAGNYDPIKAQWLFAWYNATPFADVVSSQGFGDVDFAGASVSAGPISNFKITSCLYDGSHYFASGVLVSSGFHAIYRCSPGGAWSQVFLDNSVATFVDSVLTISGTTILCVYTSAAATETLAATAVVGAGAGGGWTGGIVPMNTQGGSAVYLAASSSLLVVFPNYTNPALYATSSNNGATWTTYNPASFLVNGDAPYGLTYSVADGLFVLITVGTVGGTKAHTYQSADGITWTEVGVAFAAASGVRGLASNASGCLVSFFEAASGDQTIYSVDAGVTWHDTTSILPPGATYSLPKMIASPVGFMALNNTAARFSVRAGLTATKV